MIQKLLADIVEVFKNPMIFTMYGFIIFLIPVYLFDRWQERRRKSIKKE